MAPNFTLNDVLSAPEDPELLRQHLLSIGAVAPPPEPPTAPSIAPMEPVKPATPPPAVPADFKAPVRHTSGDTVNVGEVTLSPGAHPKIPALGTIQPVGGEPEMTNAGTPISDVVSPEEDAISAGVKIPQLKPLNFKERQALPMYSPGNPASANNPEFFANQIERIEDQKRNPYGSAENHPGVIGHILHGLALAGNIAGNIVSPERMENIPGTQLNRALREQTAEANEAAAQGRETAKELATEKTRHEMTMEDQASQKIDNLDRKLDETMRHNMSTEDLGLRKRGLMRDPNNPNQTVPVPEDQLSDDEKAALELKQAGVHQKEAAALVNRLKADPNSPQNAQIRERLRIMAQNAGTAAERVGLSRDEYLRDTLGVDHNGNPLPGITYDENGKPIGTKVRAGTSKALAEFNKSFEKPAEDKELSFKQMDKAYQEYQEARARGEELPTGAQSMVALSNHLSTTFGNVKGARITKDMIHEHLGARSISDAALVAVQRLTNGDVLSPAQWRAFHDLVSDARRNAWQEAGKEAVRADLPVDFLPEDLANDTAFTGSFKTPVVTTPGQAPTRKTGEGRGGSANAPAAWTPPAGAPSAAGVPDNKVLKDGTGKIVAVAKGGQWQQPKP